MSTRKPDAADEMIDRLTYACAIAHELVRADPGGERADVWGYFAATLGEALAYLEEQEAKA